MGSQVVFPAVLSATEQPPAGNSGTNSKNGNSGSSPNGGPPNNKGLGSAYLLLGAVLLGLGIGYSIDNHYGTMPGWTIGMTVLFTVAGLYQMVKDAMK
jgi:F0F1-type ATP synthase assembly protein I